MFDFVIIGAGPAGSTLARLLDKRFKVAVIDKKDTQYHTGFRKPCGGLLAPDAQGFFAKAGLSLPLKIMADPQIFAVHTIDLKSRLERVYQRMYLNFNRHEFDLWLESLIPPHVQLLAQARCHSITKLKDHFAVEYSHNGTTNTIFSKYIIGADGAHSVVRKTFCPTPIRQYICIQQAFALNNKPLPYYTCFFHPDITDCYGWINVKDQYAELGAALPRQNPRRAYEALRRIFVKKGFPFEKPENFEACLVNRPKSLKELELGCNGAFLIGEAAGFVSPSSLEGISFAMESADIFAAVCNNYETNLHRHYRKAAWGLYAKIAIKLLKSPFMYYPPLRWCVMKSGITAIKPTQTPILQGHKAKEKAL